MTFTSFGPLAWAVFGAVVLAMLVVDLGAAPGRHVGFRAAALRSAVWIAVGLAFGLAVYWRAGSEAGLAYWAAYLLEQNPSPTEDDIRKGLEGNLCRCTGYVNIVKAVASAAATMSGTAKAAQPAGAQAGE